MMESSRIDRWIAGAHRWAEANPSDPFALRRALCHIVSGVVGIHYDEEKREIIEAYYDARSDGGGMIRP
jgi:hypothetical protein